MPTLAGVAVAAATLVLLVRAIRGTARPEAAGPVEGTGPAGGPEARGRAPPFPDRGGGAAALAVAAGGLGDALLGRFSVASSRAAGAAARAGRPGAGRPGRAPTSGFPG